MKGDFSRNTFDKKKHFTSVRMQQGRVQLDADWNEQMDIIDNRIRVGSEDFIGGSGAPSGAPGYKITATTTDLTISKGRFYVQGILIENENDISYSSQTLPDKYLLASQKTDGLYLAYLDVWQQGVSAAIDPSIEEPALNGADTTMRVKNVAQVKLLALANSQYTDTALKCSTVIDKDTKNKVVWQTAIAASTGKLSAKVSANANLKNQLYRVEIHEGGDQNKATFKWSRDNGALIATIKDISDNVITISSIQNKALNFKANQWVELSTIKTELQNKSGIFVQLIKIDRERLTLSRKLTAIEQAKFKVNNKFTGIVRKWDNDVTLLANNSIFTLLNSTDKKPIRKEGKIIVTLATNAILPDGLKVNQFITLRSNNTKKYLVQIEKISDKTLTLSDTENPISDKNILSTLNRFYIPKPGGLSLNNNSAVNLENGLSITFAAGTYKTGDYWLIPTRAETNNIASAQYDFKTPQSPEGIVHYYAQLALVRKTSTTWEIAGDCRNLISALGNKAYQSASGAPNASVNIDKTGNVEVKAGNLNVGTNVANKNLTVNGKTTTKTLAIKSDSSNYIIATNKAGWLQQQKLEASDKANDDNFGKSVAVSGDYAIVGVPNKAGKNGSTTVSYAGAAYIYKRTSNNIWGTPQKLELGNKTMGDLFGDSVAMSGDYAIVGASGRTGLYQSGAAYIYKRTDDNTWSTPQKLEASDKATNDYFGSSVAISGDYVIVGAWGKNSKNGSATVTNSGAVYIYKRTGSNTWSAPQKLETSDKLAEDVFGSSVAINGDYAIVGAVGRTGKNGSVTVGQSGAAYIYKRTSSNTWGIPQKLQFSDKANGDNFGRSVAISGDYAIVGAAGKDGSATLVNSGAAYIYKRTGDNTWSAPQKLEASDKAFNDNFGYSVAISGNYAVIGAYFKSGSTTVNSSGAAYIYKRTGDNTWSAPQKLELSDKATNDYFGFSVAMGSNCAIVGAYGKEGKNGSTIIANSGAVYSYSLQNTLNITPQNSNDKLGIKCGVAVGTNYVNTYAIPKNGLIVEGKVGIGKSNPTEALEVNGRIKDAKGYVMPKGGIIMWSGSESDVPQGWALCNGSNGTPDLRDRFILAAGSTYKAKTTGGSHTHTLTVSEMPAHNHANGVYKYLAKSDGRGTTTGADFSTGEPNLVTPGEIQPAGGNKPHNNMPAYYTLAFIMKL